MLPTVAFSRARSEAPRLERGVSAPVQFGKHLQVLLRKLEFANTAETMQIDDEARGLLNRLAPFAAKIF